MQRIVITGATGFIGTHVLGYLKELGAHRAMHIICVGRDEERLAALDEEYLVYDLNQHQAGCCQLLGNPDLVIHLAWEGLPNYGSLDHIERNLVNSYTFLKAMIQGGVQRVAVAGTCLEYGMQEGCLSEENDTRPVTSYGLAKDSLRRFLEVAGQHHPFELGWLRLFYTHGPGQHKSSLMSVVERAISSKCPSLETSGGEQLRDFLPVEEMARLMVKVALQTSCSGVFNICSGRPISVRKHVETAIRNRKAKLKLILGALPYPEYEPMTFWGDRTRLDVAVKAFDEEWRRDGRDWRSAL